MNKQQLANKIWESANKMRSKIEANEYKDYILGFIFYKFLSDKEVDFLKKDGYEEADLQEHVHENNEELVDYCQQHLGYFIAYDNLFSTWLDKGNSFTVDNVRTALSAFNRLISDTQKKVFSKIFNTLETGLSKLGDSTSNQTKAIRDLIQLIKDIPTDGRQDYDVLGFIKEFAAKLAEIYADITSPELLGLQGYAALIDAKAGKAAKLQYIFEHKEVNWAFVDGNAPYTKGKVAAYMKTLHEAYSFPEDSFEAKMVCADKLMTEEKAVKKDVKEKSYALHMKTKETIEGLRDEQVLDLLRLKWIVPLCASLRAMPDAIIDTLEKAVQALADKYAVTYLELDEQIQKSEEALSSMIDELTGNEYDMKGLAEFKALMAGESDE